LICHAGQNAGPDPVKIHKFASSFTLRTTGLDEIETALTRQDMAGLAALGTAINRGEDGGCNGFADLCSLWSKFNDSADIEQARSYVVQMRPLLARIAAQIQQELR